MPFFPGAVKAYPTCPIRDGEPTPPIYPLISPVSRPRNVGSSGAQVPEPSMEKKRCWPTKALKIVDWRCGNKLGGHYEHRSTPNVRALRWAHSLRPVHATSRKLSHLRLIFFLLVSDLSHFSLWSAFYFTHVRMKIQTLDAHPTQDRQIRRLLVSGH